MKKVYDIPSRDKLQVVVARNLEEIEAIRPLWEKMQRSEPYPVPNADIDNYLSIIHSMKGSAQPYIIIINCNSNPEAMVICRVGRQGIPCRLGYTSILNISLRCLTVVYGGILGHPNTEVCSVLIKKLMQMLYSGEVDVVNFNNLPIDSEIYNLAKSTPFLFCRDHFPIQGLHLKSSLPNSYEDFLSSCSKNTRHNIRRYYKRLVSKYGDRISIKCFTETNQVDKLFSDTMEVAKKTYQNCLLDTFVYNINTRILLKMFVERKLLNAYVLYIDEKPCAFWKGIRYGKTFFTWTTGYDPAFKNDRLGLILLVRLIEELCLDRNVNVIDFGFGDAQYKRSFCDISLTEVSIYIFAPRLYPLFVNALRSSTMAVNLVLKYILNKIGAVDWVKRRWRNLLQTKNPGSSVE